MEVVGRLLILTAITAVSVTAAVLTITVVTMQAIVVLVVSLNTDTALEFQMTGLAGMVFLVWAAFLEPVVRSSSIVEMALISAEQAVSPT